jgi:hypothetical protein
MRTEPATTANRVRHISARDSFERPRTYQSAPPHPAQRAAYRRLAVTILGLDVATLANELRTASRSGRALLRAA